MNGQLALMAALAGVGGRWLREATGPVPDLMASNSSFQYVGAFSAQFPPRGWLRRAAVAETPEAWLAALRERGVTELSLVTELPVGGALPPHVASAFSNSGTWGLLARDDAGSALWGIGWEVGDRSREDSRIWSLTAVHVPASGLTPPSTSVADARERLRHALREIRVFASETDEVQSWADWFTKAETLLDDPAPVPPYHRDLLPSDATLDRRQLAAAVVQGWVFGGMGSWNDGGCVDPAAQQDYDRLGVLLYSALLAGVAAAANGS